MKDQFPGKFTVHIDGIKCRLLSMNVSAPKLFQVYITQDEKEVRYHVKLTESGSYEFALRESCPKEVLALEAELSEQIRQHCIPA